MTNEKTASWVYMLRCKNGSLYTGWTNDLAARLRAHRQGKGAKYTRAFGAQALIKSHRTAHMSQTCIFFS